MNRYYCNWKHPKRIPFGWAVPWRSLRLAVRSVQSGQCTVTWPTGLQAIPPLRISSQQGNFLPGSNLYLALPAPTFRFRYKSYASHSFPIGVATTATEAGLPPCMTERKNRALQVPPVVPYKALGTFSKALYGTTRGTCSARFFRVIGLLLCYPNPWWLVQRLLHSIHQDTCFNTPCSPGLASRRPWYQTTSLESKHRTM